MFNFGLQFLWISLKKTMQCRIKVQNKEIFDVSGFEENGRKLFQIEVWSGQNVKIRKKVISRRVIRHDSTRDWSIYWTLLI